MQNPAAGLPPLPTQGMHGANQAASGNPGAGAAGPNGMGPPPPGPPNPYMLGQDAAAYMNVMAGYQAAFNPMMAAYSMMAAYPNAAMYNTLAATAVQPHLALLAAAQQQQQQQQGQQMGGMKGPMANPSANGAQFNGSAPVVSNAGGNGRAMTPSGGVPSTSDNLAMNAVAVAAAQQFYQDSQNAMANQLMGNPRAALNSAMRSYMPGPGASNNPNSGGSNGLFGGPANPLINNALQQAAQSPAGANPLGLPGAFGAQAAGGSQDPNAAAAAAYAAAVAGNPNFDMKRMAAALQVAPTNAQLAAVAANSHSVTPPPPPLTATNFNSR